MRRGSDGWTPVSWRRGAVVLGLLGVIAIAGHRVERARPIAFVGGQVMTMDGESRVVEALLVRRGRIDALGTREAILARRPFGTRVIELDGATLLPGFIDAHGHFPVSGLAVASVDLAPPPLGEVGDVATLLARIGDAAEEAPGEGWLLGFNYDNTALADGRHPTRDALDRVSGGHPVYLRHGSGHMGVANSRALAALGIEEADVAVVGGVLGRDAAGRLDGLLQERSAPSLARLLRDLPLHTLPKILFHARDEYLAAGMTTVQSGGANARLAAALRWSARLGLLPQRVVIWPLHAAHGASARTPSTPSTPSTANDDGIRRARIGSDPSVVEGPLKLLADGSPQGLTAWLSRPYDAAAGLPAGDAGFPAMPVETLHAHIAHHHAAGQRLAIHANGDAAIEAIIDGVARAQLAHPRDDPRHVLVHAQTIRRDQLARLGALGLTPSFFVGHTFYWGDWHRQRGLGAERARTISPTGWARELGVRYTLHADTPVTPMDPMQLLWSATERLTASGYLLGPEQRVSRLDALRALTIDAAWQSELEAVLGSLEVGKLADLVVLSGDPLSAPDVRELHVTGAWIGGIERYRRAGAGS